MHIYYYYKDGYYFVMNQKGILEKYSVKNNIEMILKLENIIQYFTKELNEENTIFHFKTYQELTIIEKNNLLQILLMASLFEYTCFEKNVLPLYIMELSIANILNQLYSNKKTFIKNAEALLEELYQELLIELNENLEKLKQISVYKKEIVSLNELDAKANKIYINQEKEIEEYCTDIDIQYELNLCIENIFYNNEYERLLEMGVTDKEELDYQRKIKRIKEQLQKEFPNEVKQKLNISMNRIIMHYTFLIANGSLTLAAVLQIIKKALNIELLNKYDDYIFYFLILLNIPFHYIYEKNSQKSQNIEEPTLKLKKEK